MMAPTHRAMASAWWLGGVAVINAMGAGIDPITAAAGAVITPVFGAGRLSPDADVTWLSRLGHRQVTHRPDTTAMVLTGVTFAVWLPILLLAPDVAAGLHWLVWAPVTGWWSHLVGDAIFGRIPVGRRVGRVLARVLPTRLIRASGGRQAYWVGVGWDTDGLLERGNRRSKERDPRTGLHKTRKGLPFAPATVALRTATGVLYLLVTISWIGARS